MSKAPIFSLDQKVKITLTGQVGTITGISQYTINPAQYLVEHVDGQGNFAERWLLADNLEIAAA